MRVTGILLTVLMLGGCGPSLRVQTDFDPDYDLWKYSTFNWAQVDSTILRNPAYYTELNDRRIKEAVMRQLAKHGYQLTNEKPDLILQYHIVVEDKTMVATEPFGYMYSPYYTRKQQNVYAYKQGTLILDLTDTRINQLIWRSWAVSDVDGITSPDQITKLVNQAVKEMFTDFPSRKKN